jgi:gliding motility-associated lipoprotein GldH
MRFFLIILCSACALWSCDRERLYEKNQDFDNRYWPVSEKPVFEFTVADTVQAYTLYCNVRNSIDYPYSRIFIQYSLQDSTGNSLKKDLISDFLFDEKTGQPLGNSGVGDIYDQRIVLLKNHTFKNSGKHTVQLEQFMRTDTLQGVLAVGVRVEHVTANE